MTHEPFEIGQEISHPAGRTITEHDDTLFSLMSMNQHPVHIDANYAAATQHGQRLVVGPLVIAIVIGMSEEMFGGRATVTLEYRDIQTRAAGVSWRYDLRSILGSVEGGERGHDRVGGIESEGRGGAFAGAASDHSMNYGKFYEEFTVGDVYKHWPGRTITEHDNTWFALMSMNQNPRFIDHHVSPERPVVETLVFSLAVGMSVGDTSGKTIANLGFEFVKFEKPLHVGDSLYAESEVLELRPSESKPDRGLVYLETRAFNQRMERVMIRATLPLSSRPEARSPTRNNE